MTIWRRCEKLGQFSQKISKIGRVYSSKFICIFSFYLTMSFYQMGSEQVLESSKRWYTYHGLRTSREEIAFTARPEIHSHSQIFRYGQSMFCLPHWPNFSDIIDLCFHWLSVVRVHIMILSYDKKIQYIYIPSFIEYFHLQIFAKILELLMFIRKFLMWHPNAVIFP